MIVKTLETVKKNGLSVACPKGGFISNRYLTERDGMGFGLTKTIIPVNGTQHWHYKNHLEACICVSGKGILTDIRTGNRHDIIPDTMYALNCHDDHLFEAIEETTLICVFNPALVGTEVHKEDASY